MTQLGQVCQSGGGVGEFAYAFYPSSTSNQAITVNIGSAASAAFANIAEFSGASGIGAISVQGSGGSSTQNLTLAAGVSSWVLVGTAGDSGGLGPDPGLTSIFNPAYPGAYLGYVGPVSGNISVTNTDTIGVGMAIEIQAACALPTPTPNGSGTPLAVKAKDKGLPGGKTLICYPNPAKGECTAIFDLSASNAVKLVLYNIRGEKVTQRDLGWLSVGVHSEHWDLGTVASGLYFVVLEKGTGSDDPALARFKLALVH